MGGATDSRSVGSKHPRQHAVSFVCFSVVLWIGLACPNVHFASANILGMI